MHTVERPPQPYTTALRRLSPVKTYRWYVLTGDLDGVPRCRDVPVARLPGGDPVGGEGQTYCQGACLLSSGSKLPRCIPR